jgi:hypothetical protein
MGFTTGKFERLSAEVVVFMNTRNPMTLEIEAERAQLRLLMGSPQSTLPEYAADGIVLSRIGRVLAEAAQARKIGQDQ